MRKATDSSQTKKSLRRISSKAKKPKQDKIQKHKIHDNSQLKAILRQFYRIQEHRIAFSGQIRALGEDKQDTTQLELYLMRLQDLEKEMEKYLKGYVEQERLWQEYLKGVKGIGPIFAATILTFIDIKKAKHISSLWKVCGLAVIDGKADRPKRGEKLSYNPLLKQLMWKVSGSFLKCNSPYRRFYDERKEFEEKNHSELRKAHIHMRCLRFMSKQFLSDLFLNWRELKGLPVDKPYVNDILSHTYDESRNIKPKKIKPQGKKKTNRIKRTIQKKKTKVIKRTRLKKETN